MCRVEPVELEVEDAAQVGGGVQEGDGAGGGEPAAGGREPAEQAQEQNLPRNAAGEVRLLPFATPSIFNQRSAP